MTPRKVPVALPANDNRSIPTRSSASHDPRHLQQQPLLRVRRRRFPGRHTEDAGVELCGVIQEPAIPRGTTPQRIDVPSPIRRKLRDRVHTTRDKPPQALRRGYPTGVAAAHADNRDGFTDAGLQLAQPAPGTTQLGGDTLEVVENLLITHLWIQIHIRRRAARSTADASSA